MAKGEVDILITLPNGEVLPAALSAGNSNEGWAQRFRKAATESPEFFKCFMEMSKYAEMFPGATFRLAEQNGEE